MPLELKKRPDLTLGKDRGRIWRIVPAEFHDAATVPALRSAPNAQLASLLANTNAWWRVTAQRLLLERQDPAAVELLRTLIRQSDQPVARAHAAWLLESFEKLDDDLLLMLLNDPHPRVREHAVRLCEPRIAASRAFQARLKTLAADPDARLRFQVALSLGEWDDDQIIEPLARIAVAGMDDRWTRFAVASSVPKRAGALITLLLKPSLGLRASGSSERYTLLRELAALVGGRRERDEVLAVVEAALGAEGADAAGLQMAVIAGLAEGMGRRGSQLGAFLTSLKSPSRAIPLSERLSPVFEQAAAAAADTERDLHARLDALRLLAHATWETAGPVLSKLLASDPAQEVRLAALRALAAHPGPEPTARMMDAWQSATPALRRELTAALLRQPERIEALLDALEAQRIKPSDLDPAGVRQLSTHSRTEIRERARKVLKGAVPEERLKAVERYREAIELAGDPERGRAVFKKTCATCHEVAGVGVRVGPDIADTRTKTREALLGDILNPNQAIDGNYINYVVSTKDGTVHNGTIAAETSSSLTLRRAENQTDVILRQDIDEIRSTGQSLMPEGLEQSISVAEMADLLTFLKDWRYLDGSVPRGSGDPRH
jgi:putative heme-binding domain-containing protein